MNKKQPWRLILFIEALIILLLFLTIGGYVLWEVWPMDQYCYLPEQCVPLTHWMEKVKLAMAAGTLFIYSFFGPLILLLAIPFLIVWLLNWRKS